MRVIFYGVRIRIGARVCVGFGFRLRVQLVWVCFRLVFRQLWHSDKISVSAKISTNGFRLELEFVLRFGLMAIRVRVRIGVRSKLKLVWVRFKLN